MMKKIVFIIPPKDFRDAELLEPVDILKNAGISIAVASKVAGLIVGADGAKVQASRSLSELDPVDYDAIAFIGGPGTVPLINDSNLIKIAQDFFKANKITAAICAASAILANAGLLSGKNATSWVGVQKILTGSGAHWQNTTVVVDGQIITAQGPSAVAEFGRALQNALSA